MVQFPELEDSRLGTELSEMAWVVKRYLNTSDIEESLTDIRELRALLEASLKEVKEIESKLATEVIYTSECEDEPWWNK